MQVHMCVYVCVGVGVCGCVHAAGLHPPTLQGCVCEPSACMCSVCVCVCVCAQWSCSPCLQRCACVSKCVHCVCRRVHICICVCVLTCVCMDVCVCVQSRLQSLCGEMYVLV